MRISTLKSLLHGRISPAEFSRALSAELSEHMHALAKKGSSAPVSVVEDEELAVAVNHLQALCSLYVDGKLEHNELAYIADIFQLSERITFVGSGVADLVAEMTDPEINGLFTKERALEIISHQA